MPNHLLELDCIKEFRYEMNSEELVKSNNYNILKLNKDRLFDLDASLFVLAGEYVDGKLVLFEEGFPALPAVKDRLCLNSTVDYNYEMLTRVHESNLQTLWGSIALGISAFGMLILIITGIYTFFNISQKQRSDYSGESATSLPLHYLLLLGLLLLFSSALPFLLPVANMACALRSVLPGVSFSIILSSMFVNLVSTWRRTVYTVNPRAPRMFSGCLNPTNETAAGLLMAAIVLSSVQVHSSVYSLLQK